MENKIKLKELHVTIQEGVVLKIDVSSIEDVKEALDQLTKADFIKIADAGGAQKNDKAGAAPPPPPTPAGDDPISAIETRAELAKGALTAKNILAIKDGIPQLLKPNSFDNVTDALLVLLFATEITLKNAKMEYDALKSLYEGQGIKSGSSFALLLNNLKNAQYIDKKLYDTNRTISLTAKGEKSAIDILKRL